jgi:outer membrane receptor protein involved in Fe transport
MVNESVLAPSEFGNRVTRGPNGQITLLNLTYMNATEYKTSGWNYTADYRRPTPFGTFSVHAMATVMEHQKEQTTFANPLLEYVGFPAEGGAAKTKMNATLTWRRGGWTLGWTTTWFDGYKQETGPGDPILFTQAASSFTGVNGFIQAQGSNTIPSQMYHEIFGSYAFGRAKAGGRGIGHDLLSGLTVQVGVKNVLNTMPPLDAAYAPYLASPYGDLRLRDGWVSVRKSF